jgi:hypothetical protein
MFLRMKKKSFELLSKLMLFVLAVVSGGAAMAVDVMTPGTDGADPNAGTPLEGAIHADPTGIEVPGGANTGSAITEAELDESAIDTYVSEYQPWKYPLHTDFMRLARQIKVDTKEPVSYEIGDAILEATTNGTATTKGDSVDISKSLYAADRKLFTTSSTFIVEGVDGVNEKGEKDGTPLMCFVTEATKSSIMVEAVNSEDGKVPVISANTTLYIMAPALSESQVEVTPDAFLPTEQVFYLQKKGCTMTWTEFFERIKKKAKYDVQTAKNKALDVFRQKCTRSLLRGVMGKKAVFNPLTGTEYAYTQKGLLYQIKLGYQIDNESKLTLDSLIGIAQMLFGRYSTSDTAEAYCSPSFMRKLLNLDLGTHREVSMTNTKILDINVTQLKTPFGTINFKLEHGLVDAKLDGYAVIFPMKQAKRLYYQKGKFINTDHEKGQGGEVREAKSQHYIQDDCLALEGYTSMLVGPNVAAASYSRLSTIASDGASFPASPAEGTIFYLTADNGDYNQGLYEFVEGEWAPYHGEINA